MKLVPPTLAVLLAVTSVASAAPAAAVPPDQPDLFVQGQWDPRPSGRNVHGTCEETDQSSGGGGVRNVCVSARSDSGSVDEINVGLSAL